VLQGDIDNKQKIKEQIKYEKIQEASIRLEEQRKTEEMQKMEKEKEIIKRNMLASMNIKQMEEYKIQQEKQKAEENAFALQSNKGAEEKERALKAVFMRKQQQYSKDLVNEIEVRRH